LMWRSLVSGSSTMMRATSRPATPRFVLQGLGFRIQGLRLRVCCLRFWVQGPGFRVVGTPHATHTVSASPPPQRRTATSCLAASSYPTTPRASARSGYDKTWWQGWVAEGTDAAEAVDAALDLGVRRAGAAEHLRDVVHCHRATPRQTTPQHTTTRTTQHSTAQHNTPIHYTSYPRSPHILSTTQTTAQSIPQQKGERGGCVLKPIIWGPTAEPAERLEVEGSAARVLRPRAGPDTGANACIAARTLA